VGAIIYNLVLAYDGDKMKTAPNGWADFFDSKKVPGKRAIRNGAKWNLEIALIADGVPAKDVYKVLRTPEGVERAFKKLDTIKPDLVFWKSGAQPPQMLAAGDVVMTTAYNGRITAANEKDKKNFKMVWKDTPYTMDSWVIMKGTPNKANAEKLVEFMGRAREPGQAAQVRALRRHRRRRGAAGRQEPDGRTADQPRQPEAGLRRRPEVLDRQRRQAGRALDQVVRHEVSRRPSGLGQTVHR
jgi:putative spermidine/putrescine transport system substrate-binding protein